MIFTTGLPKIVDEGKHLFLKVSPFLNENGMIELEYQHFVAFNDDVLYVNDC